MMYLKERGHKQMLAPEWEMLQMLLFMIQKGGLSETSFKMNFWERQRGLSHGMESTKPAKKRV